MSGTAHIEMGRKLLGKILSNDDWKNNFHIISAQYFGEKDFYHVYVESPFIPDGYQGQQNVIIDDEYNFHFKKDQDV